MAENRVRLIISGRVQGVFFRASTCEEAQRLGLKGWVRNLPNGCVEVLAEGPPDKIEALKSYCWQGPSYARVSKVEIFEEGLEGEVLPPFTITY